MFRNFVFILTVGGLVFFGGGCGETGGPISREEAEPAGADDWLRGDAHAKFDTVAAHLRGMDMAMIEIGYRYGELHWAGEDRNWAYAGYQAEKIQLAMQQGLERRPQRTESAQPFMEEDLPVLFAAIESADAGQFEEAMERLRVGCMKCHVAEEVPHFTVYPPEHRLSPIRSIP